MLSTRTLPYVDMGPLRPSLAQGFDELHEGIHPRSVSPLLVHNAVAAPPDAYLPETPPARASPAISRPSGPLRRHESFRGVESASLKIRSPLRHSTSSDEVPKSTSSNSNQCDTQDRQTDQIYLPDMSFTGDKRTGPRDSRSRLNNWLGRKDMPRVETSISPARSPNNGSASSSRSPSVTRKAAPPPPTTNSRFAFLANPVSTIKELANPSVPAPQNDEQLLTLDIQSALFPAGSPNDGSAFSPAAFKNLQMTATGLLNRFQVAYRQRTNEIQEIRVEREVQSEETEEMGTRVQHLKMQLEEMGRKVAERESSLKSLLEELALERKLRMEEQAASVRVTSSSDTSTVGEDLGVEEDQKRRNWRSSTGTAKSDISLDTDEESIEDASIFSRSRSPTIATSVSESNYSPVDPPVPQPKPAMLGTPRQIRSTNPQMTTFQKFLKGVTNDSASSSCNQCRETGIAWETVNSLKSENKGLKSRVEELELAVDHALDAVNGLLV